MPEKRHLIKALKPPAEQKYSFEHTIPYYPKLTIYYLHAYKHISHDQINNKINPRFLHDPITQILFKKGFSGRYLGLMLAALIRE